MIDARNTFRKLTSKLNDFSKDQLEGLTSIIKHFRGEKVNFSKNNWLKDKFKNELYEDIVGFCKIVDLKEIIGNLTTSIDEDENATNIDEVEEKKEHEEEERNKDSKNNIDDAATNGVEYMTRLEVILVDCQVEIVESSV